MVDATFQSSSPLIRGVNLLSPKEYYLGLFESFNVAIWFRWLTYPDRIVDADDRLLRFMKGCLISEHSSIYRLRSPN